MAYHINPETGNVNVCKAVRQCRFGSAPHFDTKEEARSHYETTQVVVPKGASKSEPALKIINKPRPIWGLPCPNAACKTEFHDIRSPEKAVKCFETVKHLMSPTDQRMWQKAHTFYQGEYVAKQQKDSAELLTRYRELPAKLRKREDLARDLLHASRSKFPTTYATSAGKMEQYLKDQGYRMKAQAFDYGKGKPSLGDIVFQAAQEKAAAQKTAEPALKTLPAPVRAKAPKPVTLTALRHYNLAELNRLGELERKLSTREEVKVTKRAFRKAERDVVTVLDYTDNYKTYSDFVAHLPPKSLKVYSLYQSAMNSERLNQPEVIELLETKFREAKAEETDLFIEEPTPLDEIQSLLKEHNIH